MTADDQLTDALAGWTSEDHERWRAEWDERQRQLEVRWEALYRLSEKDRHVLLRLTLMDPAAAAKFDKAAAMRLAKPPAGHQFDRPDVLLEMLREIGPA